MIREFFPLICVWCVSQVVRDLHHYPIPLIVCRLVTNASQKLRENARSAKLEKPQPQQQLPSTRVPPVGVPSGPRLASSATLGLTETDYQMETEVVVIISS